MRYLVLDANARPTGLDYDNPGDALARADTLGGSVALRREPKGAVASPPSTWTWTPLTKICEGCGQRFRLSWGAFESIAETEMATLLMDCDDVRTIEERARKLTFGDVVEGAQYCLHCVSGNDAPTEEYVGGENPLVAGERPVAAFVEDGTPFFRFGPGGSFLGHSGNTLYSVPMLANGEPDRDALNPEKPGAANVVEVTDASGLDLDEVNLLLGTTFRSADFAGR